MYLRPLLWRHGYLRINDIAATELAAFNYSQSTRKIFATNHIVKHSI